MADSREKRLIVFIGFESLELAVHVLRDHRKRALGKVAEAVRQFRIHLVYKGFRRIAAILAEDDFGHQKIPE